MIAGTFKIQWNPAITAPLLMVKILRSQMMVFNVISPPFKNNPELKVKNLQSQWDQWGKVLLHNKYHNDSCWANASRQKSDTSNLSWDKWMHHASIVRTMFFICFIALHGGKFFSLNKESLKWSCEKTYD